MGLMAGVLTRRQLPNHEKTFEEEASHFDLPLCTQTTGNYYGEIKRWRFNTARRLMYKCAESYDDGLPIDFKSADFEINAATTELKADPNKIDIFLVDVWHTYDFAIRNLSSAYEL